MPKGKPRAKTGVSKIVAEAKPAEESVSKYISKDQSALTFDTSVPNSTVHTIGEFVPVVPTIKGTISGTFTPAPLTREDYRKISDATEGWMKPAEADLLVKAAAERVAKAEEHVWVEIGSFKGRSTVLLAGELALFGEGTLYACDPMEGVMSYPSTFDEQHLMVPLENTNLGSTLEAFRSTIEATALWERVTLVAQRFTDVLDIPPRVTLAFVDGLHDFASVDADYKHLRQFLASDATVIFHDVGDWSGPTKVVNYFVECGELQIIEQADSLCVCKFLGAK